MSGIKLTPGFRFHPTDVELVKFFLKRKVMGQKFPRNVIAEVDLYKYSPWDLPVMSYLQTGDLEWYFFCPRGKKYSTGGRMNRATEIGYWKTTGKDRTIEHDNQVVGMIKTLVFHIGKAPKGERTNWVIHEFRLEDKDLANKGIPQDSYVICRLFQKEGPGPKNGAHYGKPFKEEDWDDGEEIEGVPFAPIFELAPISALAPTQPSSSLISVANDMHPSTIGHVGLNSVSCLSGLMPSCSMLPSAESAPSNQVDDLPMLDSFKEDDNSLAVNENNRIEMVENPGQANNAEGTPGFDPNEFFGDLCDLDGFSGLGEGGFSGGQENMYTANELFFEGNFFGSFDFLELVDLDDTKPGGGS